MMELTGERFSSAFLERSKSRDEYFDASGESFQALTVVDYPYSNDLAGSLLRIHELYPTSLEDAMANYNVPQRVIIPAATFIRACLRFDPTERASAKELQMHPCYCMLSLVVTTIKPMIPFCNC